MTYLNILTSVGVAIVLGIVLAFIISHFLIKRKKKGIEKSAYAKILKQDQEFVIDGKKYNLKAEVKKEIQEKKELKGFEPSMDKRNDKVIQKLKKTKVRPVKKKYKK